MSLIGPSILIRLGQDGLSPIGPSILIRLGQDGLSPIGPSILRVRTGRGVSHRSFYIEGRQTGVVGR